MAMAICSWHFISSPSSLHSRVLPLSPCSLPRLSTPAMHSPLLRRRVHSPLIHVSVAMSTSQQPTASDAPEEVPSSDLHVAASSVFTGVNDSPLMFWESHRGMQSLRNESKGWLNEDDSSVENPLLLAQLRLIANMAKDRVEIHSIIAQQRDNWNKLFQSTLTMSIMTATVLSALDGQHGSLSMCIPASILDAGVAAMMCVVNRFQPSQLAEEQRCATRLFKRLVNDIEYTLDLQPDLRQDAKHYLEECKITLDALDKEFPLPLTPGGLEKFPAQVNPPILCQAPPDPNPLPEVKLSTPQNGWNDEICEDLKNVSVLLRSSDIETYKAWAQTTLGINRALAIAAPIFAASGAALNIVNAFSTPNLAVLAAVSSIMAAFAAALSHDMQIGMIFELYRDCAGYLGDIDTSIQRAMHLPIDKRENGLLFHQRVAYQLGRRSQLPMVPEGSKTAAVLF